MKKLGIRLLALTLLATVTTGCASSKQENTWDKIKEKKEIVIGTEGTFAPFSYHDDNDNLVGYDVEVSRALAKELGVKVKFVEVKWDSLIAGLDSDKYDLVTNQVAITAERKKKYEQQARWIADPNVIANIKRILVDERRHVQELTQLYEKYSRR